jgi:adenylate cyclase
MQTSMSLEEFAELVQMQPRDIGDLAGAGLLDPAGEGRFDDLDLVRLMAVRHYAALGYDAPALAEGIKNGAVEPFLGEYIYPRGEQLAVDEAAERVGLDREQLSDLLIALGWTRRVFLEEDLRMLEGLKAIADAGMPPEAALEGARVFGDTLRRLAEALVRLVHVHIHERLIEEGLSEEEVTRRIHPLQEASLPLIDRIVERVFREHFLQADIEDAYVHLVDTDRVGGRGSVNVTIVFIDVESFTKLTETEGDQAAIDLLARVDALVRPLALEHGGKVVKNIGDALMLAFRRADDAVSLARGLHEAARHDASMPGLRIGMHRGPAIYRGGDYIGTTVNLASRVTGTATAGQTVLTEAVAEQLGDAAPVEPIGVRMLRGAEQPVQLYRLAPREERRDPACGQSVEAPPAARLRQGDEELWFCSEHCLREFLASAPSAAQPRWSSSQLSSAARIASRPPAGRSSPGGRPADRAARRRSWDGCGRLPRQPAHARSGRSAGAQVETAALSPKQEPCEPRPRGRALPPRTSSRRPP